MRCKTTGRNCRPATNSTPMSRRSGSTSTTTSMPSTAASTRCACSTATAICCDPEGWVYVADRENHRVQVFDGNGKYAGQWNNMHRPSGLYMESGTNHPRFYVGEIGPDMAVNINLPNCGPRVSIYSHMGDLLARLRHAHAGLDTGQFISPHGIAVDSRGDIYVGQVSFTNWGRRVRSQGEEIPPGLRSLQKLVKVS